MLVGHALEANYEVQRHHILCEETKVRKAW